MLDTLDRNRLDLIATVELGQAACGTALAAHGTLLCVTRPHDGTVSVIAADTAKLQRSPSGFGAFIGAPVTP